MTRRRRLFLPLDRRTFVKLGAAALASAALPGCGPSGPEAEEVENLIIGSGFGGSISAYRLAMAGHRSVMLERGRRWTVENPGDDVFSSMGFTPGDAYDRRSSWLSRTVPLPGLPPRPIAEYTGVLERIRGEGIDIVCPAGVGGGSLVYSGMMVRPSDDHFASVFPSEVGPRVMDPYYDRVLSIIQGSPIPMDLLAREPWAASRTFIEQGLRAGYRVERLLCGFDWDLARAEADGEIPPQLIRGSYIFGLNSGAKATLDKSYLGMAEAMGLLEVRPLHWVQRIAQDADGRFRVEVDRIDEMGLVLESKQLLARRLFVAAGTANTNALLVEARETNAIEGLPDSLGEGFGNNGQHIRARRGVGANTGAFQAGPACIMLFDRAAPIAMENGPAPVGSEMQVLIGTGQGIPSSRGRFAWDPVMRKVLAQWSPSYDAEATAATDAVIARLNMVNGGEDATRAFGLDVSITFHPLGGCVMGETTDLYGRIRGVSNLYVIDGSLIPGVTPLSNPFWTISANSERCIERIIAEDLGGSAS